MLLLNESWRLIFVGKNLFKVVRDAGLDTFEIGNSHGPEVLAGVFVVVLAGPDAGQLRIPFSEDSQVDKHAVGHVDPASIDNILAVAAGDVDVVGIYIEHVFLDNGLAAELGTVEFVFGAVKIVAKPHHGLVGYLNVEIVVPGHDLAVPPPSEQSAVGQPRLYAMSVQGAEVAADEVAKDVDVGIVGDFVLEESLVVVAAGERASRFSEVFGSLGLGWRLGVSALDERGGSVGVRVGSCEGREEGQACDEERSQGSHGDD